MDSWLGDRQTRRVLLEIGGVLLKPEGSGSTRNSRIWDMPMERSVDSVDGTRIGYLELGSGPGIVFVHGSLEAGDDTL